MLAAEWNKAHKLGFKMAININFHHALETRWIWQIASKPYLKSTFVKECFSYITFMFLEVIEVV